MNQEAFRASRGFSLARAVYEVTGGGFACGRCGSGVGEMADPID